MSLIKGEQVIIRRIVFTGTFHPLGHPLSTNVNITVDNVIVSFNKALEITSVEEQAQDTILVLYFKSGTTILDDDIFIVRNTEWKKFGREEDYALNSFKFGLLKIGIYVKVTQWKGSANVN